GRRFCCAVHRQVCAGAPRDPARAGGRRLGCTTAPAAALRQHRWFCRRARALPDDRRRAAPPSPPKPPSPPGTTCMSDRPLRLGFVVNDVATEQDNYTTIRLARRALALGHSVALIGLEGFIYGHDGH